MITLQDSQLLLSGEITQASAAKQLQQGLALLKQHNNPITLDMSQVTQADSTVVSLLAHFSRICAAQKTTLYTQNIPTNVQDLLELYGLDSLLMHPPIPHTHEHACHSHSKRL